MEELIKENQEITLTESETLEVAKNAIRTISDNLQKSKAYYNVLAANAVMKYLEDKGLISGELVNIHSSSKMLVDFELADIQLPNLFIDVRAVFDENLIFIPKKHFEHKILPDIYLITLFDDDLMNATLLGFVEPSQINTQNQNEEYYFVNKSVLNPVSKLVELIKNKPVKQQYVISEAGEDAIEKLIMLFMDHDIDNLKLEKLLDYLKNSAVAREKLVEFENFERLSYMALQEFKDLDVENNDFTKYIKTLVATDEFSQFDDKEDDLSALFDSPSEMAKSAGLFVDEDLASAPTIEEPLTTVEPVIEEEDDLPIEKGVTDAPKVEDVDADFFGSVEEELGLSVGDAPEVALEEEISVEQLEEPIEEVIEEEEVSPAIEEEVQEEPEPVVEEVPATDEFDAFDEKDEFDLPDEFSADEVEIENLAEEVVTETVPVVEDSIVEEPVEVIDSIAEIEENTLSEFEPLEETANEELELGAIEETLDEPEAIVIDEMEAVVVEEEPAVAEPEEMIAVEPEVIEEPIETEEVTEELESLVQPEVEDENVITEEDIANVSENLMEPLASEDLELQVEGLETIGEELAEPQEELELAEAPIDELSLETEVIAPEDIINDVEPKQEETQELEVAKALQLDEVNLDGETVIGLTEDVLDVENIEEVGTASIEPEELSLEELDNIEIAEESDEKPAEVEPEQSLEELQLEELETVDADSELEVETPVEIQEEVEEVASVDDFVQTVSDEEVERAIAQSQEPVQEAPADNMADLNDLDALISDVSSGDELSLEELLSIENDLTATAEDLEVQRPVEEAEFVEKEANADMEAAKAELSMLSSTLEEDPEPVIKDNTPKLGETEDDAGSDFAFAVDSKPQGGKNLLIPAVALVTVLGLAGTGAWFFLSQNKSSGTDVEISDVGGGTSDAGLDISDVAPATPATQTGTDVVVPPAPSDESVKPEPITLQKIKKDFSQPNTYLSVSRIVWDVPEYLTYNDDFNGYLQTLGSTLKLNLSSDLLLINENTIYDRVKVKIQLKESGKKYSAEITDGSGTQTVDDLVLQSVKTTLNLLQPPVNSLDTADEDLYLTIHL